MASVAAGDDWMTVEDMDMNMDRRGIRVRRASGWDTGLREHRRTRT